MPKNLTGAAGRRAALSTGNLKVLLGRMHQATPFAGYIRVSAVRGRNGDRFHSPAEQAAAIERWAEQRGYDVKLLAPELDRSGGDSSRPILEQAVSGVEKGSYRGLVVAYLSRAARSVADLLRIYERVETAGGEVISVAENIDAGTAAGRLTRNIFAAFAEFELELHRERFDALRALSVERGIWPQRQTPRGYRRHPSTRRLVPNREAPTVRRIFTERAGGARILQLADQHGMSRAGIRGLLANRVYLGELRIGPYTNRNAHPPLIDGGLFDIVSALRKPRSSTGRHANPRPLLAGLAHCAGCGSALSRAPAPRAGGGWTYACHSGNKCHWHVAIVGRALDDYVIKVTDTSKRSTLLAQIPTIAVYPVGRGRRTKPHSRVQIILQQHGRPGTAQRLEYDPQELAIPRRNPSDPLVLIPR
jgi:DNA invertase Pin-like site-specific DNA recombinase